MTFKKSFSALIAALTLTAAVSTASAPAQAGHFGNALAAGAIGFTVGAVASGLAARPVVAEPTYAYECGYRRRPVFDAYGNQVGWQRITVC